MTTSQSRSRAVIDFLEAVRRDEDAEGRRRLRHYLSLFAGHTDTLAEQYLAISREHDGTTSGAGTSPLDRYRIESEIGRGGQATVFRAVDLRLNRPVALKVLHSRDHVSPRAIERLTQESRAIARLDHPNIAKVYDADFDEVPAYIAMQLIEGVSLGTHVRGSLSCDPRETALAMARTFVGVARALHAAHEAGVLHRDVKPDNIMIDRDGRAVLVDFGLAVVRDDGDGATNSCAAGTSRYMSPEQRTPGSQLGPRTDIYALGVSLRECLPPCGFSAQAIESGHKDHRRSPRRLDDIIRCATASEACDRYPSAGAFADDLERWIRGARIRGRKHHLRRRLGPALASRGGIVSVMLLSFLGLAWFNRAREPRSLLVAVAGARDLVRSGRDSLWPIHPATLPRMDQWISEARGLLDARAGYEATVRDADAGRLAELCSAFDELERTAAEVSDRRSLSESIVNRSIEGNREAWAACLADLRADERFTGVPLTEQVGLVPLTRNPAGLWEFWHVSSGDRPRIDGGTPRIAPSTGIVLILVPPTELWIGAQGERPDGPVYQFGANPEWGPPHRVRVSAYFLSKYEANQAQWVRIMRSNPAYFRPDGPNLSSSIANPWCLPVESINWFQAREFCLRNDLDLPSGAQWECACRAGTAERWYAGTRLATLLENEWLAENSDRMTHPVGMRPPNPWGFHDIAGNVMEWCRDGWSTDYYHRLRDGTLDPECPVSGPLRDFRGGAWSGTDGMHAASGRRDCHDSQNGTTFIGFRPARPLR